MPRVDDLLHLARTGAVLLVFWVVITDRFGGTKRLTAYLAMFAMVLLLYAGAAVKREWAQLAPAGALVVAGAVASQMAPALGVDTVFNWLVLALLLTNWAPVPPIDDERRQRAMLAVLAVVPVVMSLAMLLPWLGPSPWQIVLGERFTFGQGAPPSAAVLLIGVMAATALIDRGWDWARWLQVASLAFLVLTSSRLYTGVVLLFGAAVVVRSFRSGLLSTTRARLGALAPWAIVVVLGLLRGIPRSVGTGSDDIVGGVSTSGRTEFWRSYIDAGREYLIPGGGIGRTNRLIQQGTADGWDPHTDYLFALLDVGVLGLALLTVAFVLAYRRRLQWMASEDRWVYGTVPLVLPAIVLIEPALRTLGFLLPLSVLLAALRLPRAAPKSETTEVAP